MKRRTLFGRLALWLTAFLWGTSFVVLKNTLESVSVLWLLGLRFGGAALLFLLLAGKRLTAMDRRSVGGAVLMGLCLAAAYIFQTFGLALTTPGKNAFLTAAYCVLVPFLAWLLFRTRPKGTHVLAAVLCLAGIGLVSLDGSDGSLNRGDLLTLLCGVFYALQILVMDRFVRDGDPLSLSAVQFLTTALVCLAGALLFEPPPGALSPRVWLTLLYLSFVVTALCFFLQALGLRCTPPTTASVILVFESVFGVLTSLLFYGEPMDLRLASGFMLIFLAVLLAEVGDELLGRIRDKK